jgi:hypothetical protein
MNLQLEFARSLPSVLAVLIMVLGLSRDALAAQDADKPAAKDDESAIRLEEMTEIAHAFEFVTIDGSKRTPAKLVSDPLHRWTDPTRPFTGGALWVWKSGRRPIAILGIELYAAWSLEFVSLSTGLVEAQDGEIRWRPRKAGVEYKPIPGAPGAAGDEAKRLRQMKDLAHKISGREFYENTTFPLRLLPHPIDRYADLAAGVVDGAIFISAHGTNPEVLLLIEARRQGEGPAAWTFAAAPLSRAQPTLKLGGKDIWSSPTKENTVPEDPYFDVLKGRRGRVRRSVPLRQEQQ